MTINFILNGEDVMSYSDADARLLDILRRSFNLLGAKAGCLSGRCGACLVILNNKVVPSCLVPAFRVRNSEIITIEGFSQTDEYQDVVAGFSQAGAEWCGYCDSGKILAAGVLLERIPRPSREDILAAFTGIRCRCTEPESLIGGVLAAADIRHRRLYGRGA
ncbi:MAG: 2Fe-2S iron-sulfur cluster binding domain-containing protein [Spirochaetaceae bacterium]|jgi:carbon-monoxide dehydrogenase small subunit|nr:2Fe-2S iron-sulfur cluster binding domain-containing protein [Spirochaetaceae bacterium]